MAGEPVRFASLAEFLQMDGQGLYIWAAYGITVIVLTLSLWLPAAMQAAFVRNEKRKAGQSPQPVESLQPVKSPQPVKSTQQSTQSMKDLQE